MGPPPNHSKQRTHEQRGKAAEEKGKGKEREQRETLNAPQNKKDRRRSMPASTSASSALSAGPATVDTSLPGGLDRDESEASKKTGRGRRAYQSAIRGLSSLATAVMDISFDMETGYDAVEQEESTRRKKGGEKEASQSAVYSFAGSDGNGVDLTRGRVRMAINLPLVSSDGAKARAAGTPHLISDFESPFIRARHKLKVKLGFGFGSKPLGGEGDGNWGQALVMCVPVRFTEAAPREVREQFAPLPIAQVASSLRDNHVPSLPTTIKIGEHDAPLLPSYNQLFREDGSRLADEGEDLPQYPGPTGAKGSLAATTPVMPSNGSVTAPSPQIGHGHSADDLAFDGPAGATARTGAEIRFDNRIAPSRVVDESLPGCPSVLASQQQRLELEEMELEEREARPALRLDETVNMDESDDENSEEGEGLGVFSSSEAGPSGTEEDSHAE